MALLYDKRMNMFIHLKKKIFIFRRMNIAIPCCEATNSCHITSFSYDEETQNDIKLYTLCELCKFVIQTNCDASCVVAYYIAILILLQPRKLLIPSKKLRNGHTRLVTRLK